VHTGDLFDRTGGTIYSGTSDIQGKIIVAEFVMFE
jgi:hypothetical protein